MVDGIHRWTFAGVDMSNIKTTKESEYVWVRVGNKQVLIKKSEVSKKRENAGDKPEVTNEVRR